MKRVYQRTGSKAGQNGDCFAACIASMLELSLDAVPNFHGEFVNGMQLSPGACQEMTSWFTERGLYYVEFGFHMPVEPTLARMAENYPGLLHLMIGGTNSGKVHAVIGKDGQIIHDPACEVGATVLKRACHDGYTRVGFLALNLRI